MFSPHNLATDGVFNEFQVVSARNVLIYFRDPLRERSLGLFHDSLGHLGFLCMRKKEGLTFSPYEDRFRTIDKDNRIFRKDE